MRGDFLIDGFSLTTITVGGMDATEKMLKLYNALKREDINVLLLNGCVIGWYNVVDLNRIHAELMRPLICVTYEESEGLDKYFKEYFPHDWQKRVEVYHQNGPRVPIQLHTNHTILARFLGMKEDEAKGVLNKFTLHGAVPEPLRVARLLARGLARSYANENLQFPL